MGSLVALLYDNKEIAIGRIRDVRGVDVVTFTVYFTEVGVYTLTAEYLGYGYYDPSRSNNVTVTISEATRHRESAAVFFDKDTGRLK